MLRLLSSAALIFCAALPGWAEFAWPTHQVEVRVNGQSIRAFWRDGKPYAEREQTVTLLHVRTGPREFDLGALLESKGYSLTLASDGSVDAVQAQTAGSSAGLQRPTGSQMNFAGASAAPRLSNQARRFQAELASNRRADAMRPCLVASGYRYVADTTYIRAYCVVTNTGGTTSPPCSAVGDFVDWYGSPFARDTRSIPSLEPGQSVETTFFSMVREDETHPNGVIKADKYTCSVRFIGAGIEAATAPRSSAGRTASNSSSSSSSKWRLRTNFGGQVTSGSGGSAPIIHYGYPNSNSR